MKMLRKATKPLMKIKRKIKHFKIECLFAKWYNRNRFCELDEGEEYDGF